MYLTADRRNVIQIMTLVIGFWLVVVIVPIALTAVRKAKAVRGVA